MEGTLLNREQSPRTSYEVRTTLGVTLHLPKDQVVEYTRQSSAIDEYRSLAPTVADNAAAQWKLAEWCRAQGLVEERMRHLTRVIELEPDHIAARRALGYVQLDGEWTTRADDLTAKGYQLYRGEWRTAQDIALIEARAKEKLLAKQWLQRLKRWRGELADPNLTVAAYHKIAEVRDASAVGPLTELLQAESARDVKSLYIEVLAEIGSPPALQAIIDQSLNDPDVEVFHCCADTLERLSPPEAVEKYLKALKNDNNVRLNRAGHMLGRLGDKSVCGPLIDVLITTHQIIIGPGGRAGESYSASFGSDGSSFQAGGSTTVYNRVAQNQEVLDALVRLSGGQSFGYDPEAWKRWYNAERARGGNVELR
jgi:tetratricopeptide (TPR) repeat protein